MFLCFRTFSGGTRFMLNKKICQRCHGEINRKANRFKLQYPVSELSVNHFKWTWCDDFKWFMGYVHCPFLYTWKNKYGPVKERVSCWVSTKPPDRCKYQLEHLMETQVVE